MSTIKCGISVERSCDKKDDSTYGRKRVLSKLDKMCTECEAKALLGYSACELMLSGNAKMSDTSGERIQKRRTDYDPLPDGSMRRLERHAKIKQILSPQSCETLKLFAAWQQNATEPLSDAQIGLRLRLVGKNGSSEWRHCVVAAARELLKVMQHPEVIALTDKRCPF